MALNQRVLSAPFLVVTPALCCGIVAAAENEWLTTVGVIGGVLLVAAVLLAIMKKWRVPLIAFLFAVLGFVLTRAHQTETMIPPNSKAQFVAQITETPNVKGRYQTVLATILCFKDSTSIWQPTNETVIVNVDTTSRVSIGEVISYSSKSYPFGAPYDKYYNNKGIFGRQYIYRVDSLGCDTTLSMRVDILRHRIAERIADADTSNRQSTAIMSALTVGLRDNLTAQTKKDYRNAGTSHLLAISGLHVGIIFAILNFLLRGINFWGDFRRVQSVVIILLLWGFALLSGLSASVLRAVIMFTFLQVGLMINRGNALNNLLLSAFLLLIIDPYYLFDIGFELSYLAMIGISLLYRPLTSMWQPRNRVLSALWSVVVVSFAAQLFTAPLVAYTFGQISVVGLGVNLIVWLTAPVIIVGTLSYLLLPLGVVGSVAVWTAWFQNNVMAWVGSQTWATIDTQSVTAVECLVVYSVLGALIVTSVLFEDRLKKLFPLSKMK